MGDLFISFWRINPVAAITSYVPLVAAVAVLITFYIKYDLKVLGSLKKTFKQIIRFAEDFPECKVENLYAMDEIAMEYATLEFEATWRKMMGQAERRYTGGVLPEASTFFHEKPLIHVPAHRRTVKLLYCLCAVLIFLAVLLPQTVQQIMYGYAGEAAMRAGTGPASLILFVTLIFAAVDIMIHNNTIIAFQRFIFTYDSVLPTADALAGPALLVEASGRSQKAFEQASEKMIITFTQNTGQMMHAMSEKSDQMLAGLSQKSGEMLLGLTQKSEEMLSSLSRKSEQLVTDLSERTEQLSSDMNQKTEQMIQTVSRNTEQMSMSFTKNAEQMTSAVSYNTDKMVAAFSQDTKGMAAAFTEDTDKLVRSIHEFGSERVVPAVQEGIREMTEGYLVPSLEGIKGVLNGTLEQIIRKQESGVKELTDTFADKLAGTLEVRMNRIAEALGQYQGQMEEQNVLYQDRIDALNEQLTTNMQVFFDYMKNLKEILGGSAEVLNHADEFYRFELENREKTIEHEKSMLKITDDFRKQAERFAQETLTVAQENHKAQQSFGVLVAAITDRMEDALAGAGKEIASGITGAVADNAKAIEDLTRQAQNLRLDYEDFFNRREDSTQKTMEEMDYQVQGLITRLSEDVGEMLKTAVEENREILSQYKDQTSTLLASFDEQARSMGLYAKEINMDIAEMSQNLRTSVAEFNDKIREGVQMTVSDFDKGLAELADRIANTVESIADAVENLPASIKAHRAN